MKTTHVKLAAEPSFQLSRALKRHTIKLAALAAFGIASAFAAPSQAAIQYSIANIVPNGISSYANSINNNGAVAGDFYNGSYTHAFYYNGSVTDIDPALGNPNYSYAYGLNDSGLTTGEFYTGSYYRAFIYSPSTNTAQDLSSAFPAGTIDSDGDGINNSGQVVGEFYNGQEHAFLYSNGTVQDLSSAFPIGTDYSYGAAINNSGKIVGEFDTPGNDHAFYYSNGVATDLNPALGNPHDAYAYAINNSNQVVGEADPYSGYDYAFLYSNGSATNIGSALPSGHTYSYAYGINDSGVVVGDFYSTHFSNDHAFVYSNGVAQDLNSLIDPASGWVLSSANSINNNGQITGEGTFGGQQRAFVLTLHSVSGLGTVGSGGNLGQFLFNATASPSSSGSYGTFSYSHTGATFLSQVPITALSFSGNSATFSGNFSPGKGYANNYTYVVTVVDNGSNDSFSIAYYKPGQATPYFTQSGALTSGNIVIS